MAGPYSTCFASYSKCIVDAGFLPQLICNLNSLEVPEENLN